MERYDEIFAALAAPFDRTEVLERVQHGHTFRWIQAYALRNRLDEILGAGRWRDDVWPANDGTGAYLCRITLTLPDGRETSRVGVGAPGQGESRAHPAKTAASDAFKRACEELGMARYLKGAGPSYGAAAAPPPPRRDRAAGLIRWAEEHGHSRRLQELCKARFGCTPPELGDESAVELYRLLEAATKVTPRQTTAPATGTNENGAPATLGWPHSGAALWAWCKNIEQAFQTSIIRAVFKQFVDGHGWPQSWKEWSPENVEEAAVHVAGLVAKLPGYAGQFDSHLPDLTRIKGDILARATELCKHLGKPSPTYADLVQCVTMRSAELAPQLGGECIAAGDWDGCEDVRLLVCVLRGLEADLKEAGSFTF